MDDLAYELTRAMARGDTEALGRFYELHFATMYADARRLTGRDESFCLDVVQDAMLRVIRSATPIRGDRALRCWLRLVVRSAAYDRLRSESSRRLRETAHAREHAECAVADDTELEERLAWLWRQIARMDVPEARLLVWRYRWGWTLRRIGEQLGLKPGAVDRRLRRLVAKVKDRAREHCDECE